MGDIIRTIKKQISKQTAKHLNTEVNSYPIAGFESEKDSSTIPNTIGINPTWVRGYYSLSRLDAITPDSFYNCSLPINWEVIDGRSTSINELDVDSNNLLGLQVFTTKSTSLKFNIDCEFGFLAVYKKVENSDTWEEIISTSDSYSQVLSVPLTKNKWTTIVFTFCSRQSGAHLNFSSSYIEVTSWKALDINPPDVPIWSSTPITRNEVDPATARMKLTLNWIKDTSVDLAGNGIYKWSKSDSGVAVSSFAPSTFFGGVYGTIEANKRWFVCNTSATLNSGDRISFAVGDSAPVSTISEVIRVQKNYVRDSVFSSISQWSTIQGALKDDAYGKIKSTYYNLCTIGTNTRYSLIGTISLAVSTTPSIPYHIGIVTDHNLISRRDMRLGVTDKWSLQYGDADFSATITNGVHNFLVKRRNGDYAILRTMGTFLYLSTAASYQFSISASHPYGDYYHVGFYDSSDNQVSYSPTLYSSPGFRQHTYSFTPSASGWNCSVKIHVPATTSLTSYGTIQFCGLSLSQHYANSPSLYNEYLKIEFMADATTHCATYDYKRVISQGAALTNEGLLLGTVCTLGKLVDVVIPKACTYLKLGYYATINSISTVVFINRNIHFSYITYEENNTSLTQATTEKDFIRLSSTGNDHINTDDTIYIEQYEHIADRDREASDGAIVTYDDFNIENNTVYHYYLDAYDASAFRNRSYRSDVASLNSGDSVAPKVPSYTLTGIKGGLEHSWVTPTAVDFKLVRCYNAADKSGVVFEKSGTPDTADMYLENNESTVEVNRWLTAIDSYGNESAVVSNSATPLPIDANINFDIVWKTSTGTSLSFGPEWKRTGFNRAIASFVLYNDYTIATYHYQETAVENDSTSVAAICTGTVGYNTTDHSFRYSIDYWVTALIGTEKVQSEKIKKDFWFDNKPPFLYGYSARKHRLWKPDCAAKPGYNLLKWSDTCYDDYDPTLSYPGSGISKYYIRRGEASCLNKNPLFEMLSPTSKPLSWTFATNNVFGTFSASATTFNSTYSAKLKFTGDATTSESLSVSSTFWCEANTIYTHLRWLPASVQNHHKFKLSLYEVNTSNIVASLRTDEVSNTTQSETDYWKYFSLNHIISSATVLGIKFAIASGNNQDYSLIDEFVAYNDTSLSTLDMVARGTDSTGTLYYSDTDVTSWKNYIYSMKVEDAVGNLSVESRRKLIRAVPNYRDKYRNMLNNSSFEKTYKTAKGTIRATSWDNWYWIDGEESTLQTYPQVESGDASSGNNYLVLDDSSQKIFQNDISILPFKGQARRFILSVNTARIDSDSSYSGRCFLIIKGFNKQHVEVSTTVDSTPVLTGDFHTWNRSYITYDASVASITNLSVGVAYMINGVTYIDDIQLEERQTGGPTEYYDGFAITADYIQGNLIRANMIEADSIYAKHMTSNSITATSIQANTIKSENFRLSDAAILSKSETSSIDLDRVQVGGSPHATVFEYDFNKADSSRVTGPSRGYIWTAVVATPATTAVIGGYLLNSDLDGMQASVTGIPFTSCPTLEPYKLSPVKIHRPYPYSWPSQTVISFGNKTTSSCTIWSSWSYDSDFSALEEYHLPQVIGTKMNAREGHLRYNGTLGNLYYGNRKIGSNSFDVIKLTPSGTIDTTFRRQFATQVSAFDFDVSKDRICAVYSLGTEPKIRSVIMNSSGVNLYPTLSYDTYGGHSQVVIENTYDTISAIAVSRLPDRFLFSYTIRYYGKFYYVKMISSAGTLLIGQEKDIRLCNDNLSPIFKQQDFGYTINMLSSFGQEVLFWINQKEDMDCYTGLNGVKYGISGKYLYLSATPTVVSLENLFNQISL